MSEHLTSKVLLPVAGHFALVLPGVLVAGGLANPGSTVPAGRNTPAVLPLCTVYGAFGVLTLLCPTQSADSPQLSHGHQLKHDTYKYIDPLLVNSKMTLMNMKTAIGQLKHDTYKYEDRYRST